MSQGPGLDGGSTDTPAQVDTCSFFHAGVLPRRGAAPSQPLGPERCVKWAQYHLSCRDVVRFASIIKGA